MKTRAAGPDAMYQPGQEVEVADDLARMWIAAGFAEAISPEPESAAVEPPEKSVKAPARKRRSVKSKT